MNKVKEYRIGVDIGGTFIDAIAINKTGHVITSKTSTTPDDLTNGVMEGTESNRIKKETPGFQVNLVEKL